MKRVCVDFEFREDISDKNYNLVAVCIYGKDIDDRYWLVDNKDKESFILRFLELHSLGYYFIGHWLFAEQYSLLSLQDNRINNVIDSVNWIDTHIEAKLLYNTDDKFRKPKLGLDALVKKFGIFNYGDLKNNMRDLILNSTTYNESQKEDILNYCHIDTKVNYYLWTKLVDDHKRIFFRLPKMKNILIRSKYVLAQCRASYNGMHINTELLKKLQDNYYKLFNIFYNALGDEAKSLYDYTLLKPVFKYDKFIIKAKEVEKTKGIKWELTEKGRYSTEGSYLKKLFSVNDWIKDVYNFNSKTRSFSSFKLDIEKMGVLRVQQLGYKPSEEYLSVKEQEYTEKKKEFNCGSRADLEIMYKKTESKEILELLVQAESCKYARGYYNIVKPKTYPNKTKTTEAILSRKDIKQLLNRVEEAVSKITIDSILPISKTKAIAELIHRYKEDKEFIKEVRAYNYIKTCELVDIHNSKLGADTEASTEESLKKRSLIEAIKRDGSLHEPLGVAGNLSFRNNPRASTFVPAMSSYLKMLMQPPKGYKLVTIDYVSEEIILGALISGDQDMLTATTYDYYQFSGYKMGLCTLDDVKLNKGEFSDKHGKLRDTLKTVILASNYSATRYAIALSLYGSQENIYLEQAEELRLAYVSSYPTYFGFIEQRQRDKHLPTLYKDIGFRYILNKNSAGNFYVQGGGARVLMHTLPVISNQAMINKGIQVVCSVHDEIIYYIKDDINFENNLNTCKDAMRYGMLKGGLDNPHKLINKHGDVWGQSDVGLDVEVFNKGELYYSKDKGTAVEILQLLKYDKLRWTT
jgi:hypothetical protein